MDPPRSTSQEELFSTCFATFLRLPWRVNASIISIHQDDSRRDLFVELHLLQYLEIQMSAVSQSSRSSSRVHNTFRAGQPDGISRVCEKGLNQSLRGECEYIYILWSPRAACPGFASPMLSTFAFRDSSSVAFSAGSTIYASKGASGSIKSIRRVQMALRSLATGLVLVFIHPSSCESWNDTVCLEQWTCLNIRIVAQSLMPRKIHTAPPPKRHERTWHYAT